MAENILAEHHVTDEIDKTRLAPYPLQHGTILTLINNPSIRKASSEENGTGQYPVLTTNPGKGTLRSQNQKNFEGSMPPTPLRTIEASVFDARLGNRSVFIPDSRLIFPMDSQNFSERILELHVDFSAHLTFFRHLWRLLSLKASAFSFDKDPKIQLTQRDQIQARKRRLVVSSVLKYLVSFYCY